MESFVHIHNAYEDRAGYAIGEGYYPYEYLAEVLQPTVFEVDESVVGMPFARRVTSTSWTVEGGEHEVDEAWNVTSIVFGGAGTYNVSLRMEVKARGDVQYKYGYTFEVTVKHVRREIRQLTDADRSRFLDALQLMYSTAQEVGESVYGPKFKSGNFLVRKHLYGAASKDCDHWHDDAGIVTHHLAYTLEAEQSLQAIHPGVSIPYWDYTIDAYFYNTTTVNGGGCGIGCWGDDWTSSKIFNDDWFGPVANATTHYVLSSGRWNHMPVLTNAWDYSEIVSPYGYLRSPWNCNPNPFLSRSREVFGKKDVAAYPDCSEFYTAFNSSDIGTLFSYFNGNLHGPMHIITGGIWGDDPKKEKDLNLWLEDEHHVTSYKDLLPNILLMAKFLWRQGYLTCPEFCSLDAGAENCACSCPENLREGWDYEEFWHKTGLRNVTDRTFHYADWNIPSLTKAVCHVGHVGDSFSSAASQDPIFWILHPLADRFIAYRRLLTHAGLMTLDEKWDYAHAHIASDTHSTCDWSDVKIGTSLLPICTAGTCPGHKEDDLLPFTGFQGTGDTYTNREFWDFVSPLNEHLPYTYDTFTTWPGCEAQGLYFADYDPRRR